MKKVSLVLGMVLAVSMAMAQTSVNLDQSGNSAYWMSGLINVAGIQQVGTNIDATFDQDAGSWNKVTSGQDGTNMSATLNATAGTYNSANFEQGGGKNFDIDVKQVALTGSNDANVRQPGGLGIGRDGRNIDVDQNAGTNNSLEQVQYGANNVANLKQTAKTFNDAKTYQGNWDVNEKDNVIYGASLGQWGPGYDPAKPATQTSANSSNTLKVDQDGESNKVGLYQEGFDYNNAEIVQTGGFNSLLIYQTNADGFNSVISNQIGGLNSASVLQTTVSGSGTITVDQN